MNLLTFSDWTTINKDLKQYYLKDNNRGYALYLRLKETYPNNI